MEAAGLKTTHPYFKLAHRTCLFPVTSHLRRIDSIRSFSGASRGFTI